MGESNGETISFRRVGMANNKRRTTDREMGKGSRILEKEKKGYAPRKGQATEYMWAEG